MPNDKDISKAVDDITDGNLVNKIKSNIKNASAGIAIGALLGFLLAAITGNCKICFAIGGAAVGGTTGYLLTPKKPKNLDCCL